MTNNKDFPGATFITLVEVELECGDVKQVIATSSRRNVKKTIVGFLIAKKGKTTHTTGFGKGLHHGLRFMNKIRQS